MTAVDHAELKRLADALRVSWSDRGWTPAKKIDGLLKEARQAADGLDALLSEIEGLKAERAKGPEGDAVEPIERAIKALKRDIAAIQDAKKRGGSGASLTDCINRLPEIVRWLESGLFEVEAAFEQYEDASDLRTQAPDSWRPIESAPKDGTAVQLYPSYSVATWDHGADDWLLFVIPLNEDRTVVDDWSVSPPLMYEVTGGLLGDTPTHWMPLSGAPALRPQTAESGK